MFCRYCGKAIDDDSVFCSHCGERQTGDAAQAEPGGGFAGQQNAAPQNNGYVPPTAPPQQNYYAPPAAAPMPDDAPSTGFAVLCAFFPVVGLILYLVWKDMYPLRAKSCGKGAIIGVIIEFVVGVIIGVVVGVLAASGVLNPYYYQYF